MRALRRARLRAPRPTSPTGWCACWSCRSATPTTSPARLVERAEARAVDLADLPLAEMQAVEPRITADVFDVLTVDASVASRTSFGGTAPEQRARRRPRRGSRSLA